MHLQCLWSKLINQEFTLQPANHLYIEVSQLAHGKRPMLEDPKSCGLRLEGKGMVESDGRGMIKLSSGGVSSSNASVKNG